MLMLPRATWPMSLQPRGIQAPQAPGLTVPYVPVSYSPVGAVLCISSWMGVGSVPW